MTYPPRATAPTARSALLAVLLAAASAGVLFLTLGDLNLNFADEGYLWYGVRAVLRGEVPFRDFQSYDPGRYYWAAALSPVFGSGILGVRAAVAVFQFLGIAAGLLVARRLFRTDLPLLLLAPLLALAMFPRHKLFEPTIALLLLHGCVRVLERPSTRRTLELGALVGLAAFFGRNHGLYGLVAATALLGLDAWARRERGLPRRLVQLGTGVALGYLPMLAMLAFVPGFAAAFWRALAELATKGANIPKPFPWPWRVDLSGLQGAERLAELATSVAFVLPLVLLPIAAWLGLRLLRRARRGGSEGAALSWSGPDAALLATGMLCLIYLHHVSVRSDAPHLGQILVLPLLLALALPRRPLVRLVSWTPLAVVLVLTLLQNHTSLRWLSPWRSPSLVRRDVGGESLRFLRPQAAYVDGLARDVAARLAPEDAILVAPSRPTLYPLLDRPAPIHDIYLFWFASDEEQERIVTRLESQRVRWALLVDTAVDDREDLRFTNTYPRVWQYLREHYRRVPTPNLRSDHLLLERIESGQR